MKKTCDKCKHWSVPSWESDGNGGYCESPRQHCYETGQEWQPDSFYGGGYEGFGDYFKTGPKFGCVHWEKQDAKGDANETMP